jgi:histidinol-phosphate aminotransferase
MSNIENTRVNPTLPLSKRFKNFKPYGAPVLDLELKLNTNENPYALPAEVKAEILMELSQKLDSINRYPDRLQIEVTEALAKYLCEITKNKISSNQVWAANGSNEILNQILLAFHDPGEIALGFEPSYSMHKIISEAVGYQYHPIPRRNDFSIDLDEAFNQIIKKAPRIIFITSPNNPTGTSTIIRDIEKVLQLATQSIVIVDEAYGEFSIQPSAISLIEKYSNLIVTRTMSKAFAFAGARIGYAVAQSETLSALGLVRLPYHLSTQSQVLAKVALNNYKLLQAQVQKLIGTREFLQNQLRELGLTVIESDANFFLFGEFASSQDAWQALVEQSVLVRDVAIPGFLRITVGTEEESHLFIERLKGLMNNKSILLK